MRGKGPEHKGTEELAKQGKMGQAVFQGFMGVSLSRHSVRVAQTLLVSVCSYLKCILGIHSIFKALYLLNKRYLIQLQ